ncbi:MAG: TlpA disulfide reductase family protein [Bacteroidota bacterium]
MLFSSTAHPDMQEEGFVIRGTIEGPYEEYIFLSYGEIKDSVRVIDQRFEFRGSVEKPIQGWLNLRPLSTVAWLFVENSQIDIKVTYEPTQQELGLLRKIRITEVEGSHSFLLQSDYKEFYQTHQQEDNFHELLFEKTKELISANPSHSFMGKVLAEGLLLVPYLSYEQGLELYQMLDLQGQKASDVSMIERGLEKLKQNRYGIGKKFPQVVLPDEEGNQISIPGSKGAYTLIDFWASWCGPCRAQHPDLRQLYDRYHSDSLEIIGVSIDEDSLAWRSAINKDQLRWINVRDQDFFLYQQLQIMAIPFNYLLDAEGTILGVNLTLEKVEQVIQRDKK